MDFNLKTGLSARLEKTVKDEETANWFDKGLPKVFSTPFMIALMEVASFKAIEEYLPEGYSAVGTMLDVQHLSSTPVGAKVWAQATLVEIDRKRLTFDVEAYDEAGLIGSGKHDRFIVEEAKFMQKTNKKK
jgi:predicted thioesterase